MNDIKLIECFTSFQGEGPDTGRRMLIVRFKRCDRVDSKNACKWCDTVKKMIDTDEKIYSIEKIQEMVTASSGGLMITGGEPSYEPNLDSTINILKNINYSVCNIETNGYRILDIINKVGFSDKIKYIYSPKIFSDDELVWEKSMVDRYLNFSDVYFKIVWDNRELTSKFIKYVAKVCDENMDIRHRVYIMPEGKTKEELIKNGKSAIDVTDLAGFNFSSRDHIIYNFT